MSRKDTSNTKERASEGRTDWDALDLKTDADIERAEDDAERIDLSRVRPEKGRDGKVTISIRLDMEVIDWFKLGGPGYQIRINEVLREYIRTHSPDDMPKTGTQTVARDSTTGRFTHNDAPEAVREKTKLPRRRA